MMYIFLICLRLEGISIVGPILQYKAPLVDCCKLALYRLNLIKFEIEFLFGPKYRETVALKT